ncbi:MAG: 2'-5' RNA ligase family protein [Actinomycetota bacterium]
MALAVCILFDRAGDRAVRELWSRLEAEGVPTLLSLTHGHHRAHLSYAVALKWDLDRVRDAVAALPDGGPFPLVVHGTLLFPRGRAALAASVTADVAARQDRVARAVVGTGALLHHHYEPGQWVPHVSAATRVKRSQLGTVTRLVHDVLPLTLQAESAALIDSGTGEIWPLPNVL